jgi:hypothetical protein
LRIAVLRVLDSAVTAGRRSVGEPHFSVVLAFFNVALALLLIAVVISVGFCVLVNPEAAAAAAVDDPVKTAFRLLSAAACVFSAAQLVPGPRAWRHVRQCVGVVNLCMIWPAVIAVGTVGYLQLRGHLPGCA